MKCNLYSLLPILTVQLKGQTVFVFVIVLENSHTFVLFNLSNLHFSVDIW